MKVWNHDFKYVKCPTKTVNDWDHHVICAICLKDDVSNATVRLGDTDRSTHSSPLWTSTLGRLLCLNTVWWTRNDSLWSAYSQRVTDKEMWVVLCQNEDRPVLQEEERVVVRHSPSGPSSHHRTREYQFSWGRNTWTDFSRWRRILWCGGRNMLWTFPIYHRYHTRKVSGYVIHHCSCRNTVLSTGSGRDSEVEQTIPWNSDTDSLPTRVLTCLPWDTF